jgi:hypothetical protein
VATLLSDHRSVVTKISLASIEPEPSGRDAAVALPRDMAVLVAVRHRAMLQRAAALVAAGEHGRAKAVLLDLLHRLPTERVLGEPSPQRPVLASSTTRGTGASAGAPAAAAASAAPFARDAASPTLEMSECTDRILVSRAFHLLFQCYEDELAVRQSDNSSVANLIVVCQHEWPLHHAAFSAQLELIPSRQDFYFSEFFDFVATVDVMEEFMHLANHSTNPLLVTKPESGGARTNTRHTKTKVTKKPDYLVYSLCGTARSWRRSC